MSVVFNKRPDKEPKSRSLRQSVLHQCLISNGGLIYEFYNKVN